jgi:hypothetical protein
VVRRVEDFLTKLAQGYRGARGDEFWPPHPQRSAKHAYRWCSEQINEQGIRVSLVKPAEIAAQAQAYLSQHPELYRDALHRALQMKLPMRGGIYWGELEQAIYDLVKSKYGSVSQSGSAKVGIEKTQEFLGENG